MYENSIKVPFLLSHLGRIPVASAQPAMVSAYDFMPTLLDYLNLPQPQGRNLPGSSVLPVWLGNDDTARDEVVVYDEYGATRMIRSESWKYIHRYPDGPHELYDLAHDPDERRNLIADSVQATRIAKLRARLESWFNHYVEPDKDGSSFDVTGKGQLRPVGAAWPTADKPFAASHD